MFNGFFEALLDRDPWLAEYSRPMAISDGGLFLPEKVCYTEVSYTEVSYREVYLYAIKAMFMSVRRLL